MLWQAALNSACHTRLSKLIISARAGHKNPNHSERQVDRGESSMRWYRSGKDHRDERSRHVRLALGQPNGGRGWWHQFERPGEQRHHEESVVNGARPHRGNPARSGPAWERPWTPPQLIGVTWWATAISTHHAKRVVPLEIAQ